MLINSIPNNNLNNSALKNLRDTLYSCCYYVTGTELSKRSAQESFNSGVVTYMCNPSGGRETTESLKLA